MAFRFRSGKYSAVKNPVFTLNDVACSVVFSLKNKQENISDDFIQEEPPTKPVSMRAITEFPLGMFFMIFMIFANLAFFMVFGMFWIILACFLEKYQGISFILYHLCSNIQIFIKNAQNSTFSPKKFQNFLRRPTMVGNVKYYP